MRRFLLTLALAAASAGPATAAEEADLFGARALIDGIYSAYARDEPPALADIYSAELQASIARQSDSEGGGLSYDPFCQCQDFGEFRYTIRSLETIPDGAAATIDFTNFGDPRTVRIRLIRRSGEWRVADIDNGEASLLTGR